MSDAELSRRRFLASMAGGAGALWIAASWSDVLSAGEHAARATGQPPAPFQVLTAEQAADVDAFCAQIIPTDDMPGAREARVVHFIDRALITFAKKDRPRFEQGLIALSAEARRRYPRSASFASLPVRQQLVVMRAIERSKPEFFEMARVGTIMGMFANPEYGGNHQKTGWKLIGFEDRFSWQPPFGYYDREEHRG